MSRNSYEEKRYKGTFACGHEATISVGGYTEEYREEAANDRFSGLCPKCEKKALEEKRAEQTRKSAEFAQEMGWPELTGTPKQVAWAETLRYEMYNIGSEELLEEISHIYAFLYEKLIYKFVDEETIEKRYKEILESGVSRRKAGKENLKFKIVEPPIRDALEKMLQEENNAKFFIDNQKWVYILENLVPYLTDKK